MPRDVKDTSKRRSLLTRGPLGALSTIHPKDDEEQPASLLRKRRASSLLTSFGSSSKSGDDGPHGSPASADPASPASLAQCPSVLVSPASRSTDKPDELYVPLSAGALSPSWDVLEESMHNGLVVHHGEVQTSSTMFRKKREYLVLTETHLIRFKGQHKAAEAFSSIPSPLSRSSYIRHSQSPSTGSSNDAQSVASDAARDRESGTPLRHIVAVYQREDGRPFFAIEISCLDDDTNHASSMTLQFGEPEEMHVWLAKLREAANNARLLDPNPLSAQNSHLAARVVEADYDYVPPHYAIYKVLQRPGTKAATRSSSDDLTKVVASVCFLAIGVHKVHVIPLFKTPSQRSSSPSLASYDTQSSHGILALTELRLSDTDDTFELTFRIPMHKPKVMHLASLASRDIAVRLRSVEEKLRPEWESRPYQFIVPDDVKRDMLQHSSPAPIDGDSFERTLIAYCVAYRVRPERIRYNVSHTEEDSPRFELWKPEGRRRDQYSVHELLAVVRALRYNESFGAISFQNVHLDVLNGLYDQHGSDHVCTKTKRGTPIHMGYDEVEQSCILVQEVRALAITSRKLRRLDFSSCIRPRPCDQQGRARDMGCGIVEALFPLCKYQTTNIDWITLNKIQLDETDLDYLVAAAVERDCHFRAIELDGCGLTDHDLSVILDALRAQENTLEAMSLSSNSFRLAPSLFDSQISVFAFVSKLHLAHLPTSSGPEPFISVETFQNWRLKELVLSGTPLNVAMIDSIASYLVNYKQSKSLHELHLDRCRITSGDIAYLLHSMTEKPGVGRELHLDVSNNRIEQNLSQLTAAISDGVAPTHMTIQLMEFAKESDFRRMIAALTKNETIRGLDISRASLPSDASRKTCQTLEDMFAKNTTLGYLDISGEDSRLETTKLGVGINEALRGLLKNQTLRVLHIRHQSLGLQGASTLADVLKVNSTLEQLHCDHNNIGLSGLTDLVNALHRNTTLLFLPEMQESRQMALKQTEDHVKQIRDEPLPQAEVRTSSMRQKLASRVAGKSTREKKPAVFLSDQDIKAALRLVDESWERQTYRLQQYLRRNLDIARGMPAAIDIDDEDFERPDTAASLSKVVEKVTIETTPTAEKDEFEALFDSDRDNTQRWLSSNEALDKDLEKSMLESKHAPPWTRSVPSSTA